MARMRRKRKKKGMRRRRKKEEGGKEKRERGWRPGRGASLCFGRGGGSEPSLFWNNRKT